MPPPAATVPVIPDSAPFTAAQRAWLNGFFAGLFSRGAVDPAAAAAAGPSLTPLTVLFGSQTGTAEGLAKRTAKEAGRRGFAATVIDLAAYTPERLRQEKNVLLISSTYGEGEPPDNVRAFHAALAAPTAPRLDGVRFSVCALGDTNYAKFCQCGKDFDARLETLGATRAAPRADCDVEVEKKFAPWLDAALAALGGVTPAVAAAEPAEATVAPASVWSRQNPFPAPVVTSRNLSGPGSAKQVHQVELSLEGSGLDYVPGDALGVRPHNCPELVAEVLAALECDGEEAVPAPDGGTTSLRRALSELYCLGRPTEELVQLIGRTDSGGVAVALPQVIDVVLARRAVKPAPADFVRALRPLQSRLYSIASSPQVHPGQVHLTVGVLRYQAEGRRRKGVCSTFLADRVIPGQTQASVHVHANPGFRLPADGGVPIIMVGPGTGVAPFRAFLEERQAAGARGRNWLFFGDQHEADDFLYRDQILGWQRDGLLTRLDLAWSRDQADKVYVQHRLREQAAEVFAWLEAGAHFYVCGDASRMAKDVDAALREVIARAGGRTAAQADEYVQRLQVARRYVRDVY